MTHLINHRKKIPRFYTESDNSICYIIISRYHYIVETCYSNDFLTYVKFIMWILCLLLYFSPYFMVLYSEGQSTELLTKVETHTHSFSLSSPFFLPFDIGCCQIHIHEDGEDVACVLISVRNNASFSDEERNKSRYP